MKTFEKGNWNEVQKYCPICKQQEGEIILVPIVGTQDGNLSQAIQVHPTCIIKHSHYYPPRPGEDETGVFASSCPKD